MRSSITAQTFGSQPCHSATALLPRKGRSATPILLEKKPLTVRSRKRVKKAAQRRSAAAARAGQGMRSRICFCPARSEVQPVVDKRGDAGGGGAAGVFVGGDDEIAEHLRGAPLVVVEDLPPIRLLGGCGRRGVDVPGWRLRGRGGGRDTQDVDEIAARDVHVLLLKGLAPKDSVS